MAEQNDSRATNEIPTNSSSTGDAGNLADRVRKLQEKANHLAETLESVDHTLKDVREPSD